MANMIAKGQGGIAYQAGRMEKIEIRLQRRINVLDAPPPEKVGMPAFIDIGQ
jgi:hypothetical protein